MTVAEIRISAIAFEHDLLVISYIELPTDVRVKGQVVQQHQVQLSLEHPDYDEDASALHARAVKALRNALEDFETSDPYDPETPDPDDERGMGE